MTIEAIDMKKCIRCGMCEKYCPMDVIRFDAAEAVPVVKYPEDCMLCCLCKVKCPAQAITVSPEKKYDAFLAWS